MTAASYHETPANSPRLTRPWTHFLILGVGLARLVAGCAHADVQRPPEVAPAIPPIAVSRSEARAEPQDAETAAISTSSPAASASELEPTPEEPPPAPPPFRLPLDARETDLQRLSWRIANSSPGTCRAELKRRQLPVAFVGGNVRGVAVPVRLTGELRGVRFLAPGKRSVYGMVDCRLVVVLDELAGILAQHGVTAVHVDNIYRPRAHLPRSRKRSQHAYGLAIDIYGFTLADGTTLVIERDFNGTIGEAPCGPESDLAPSASAQAVSLRTLTCAIAATRLFNHLLTPNYDAAHRNHLHADIRRGGSEYVVR
jgi:hypothetical protein